MKALFKDNWANEYYTWLKAHTSTRELTSGWTEIATPFLNRHNDGITIYLRQENEKIILSDDGYTLSDLEDSGCYMNTLRRKHILNSLLNSCGLLHRMDFVIPKSKKSPERFIAAVNAPNSTNSKLTLFNWQDIRPARSDDSILYVFLNDNRKVARNVIDAYKAYQVKPVLWSKRDKYLEQLIS